MWLIGLGYFLLISAALLTGGPPNELVDIVALGLIIYGSAMYARRKGYNGWLGAGLGLLMLVGLIILTSLPNRQRMTE